MPPKAKKPDANKNQGPVEDETGIPKNEVSFKFSFEVKQNEIADILIMFEWVSSTDPTARQKFDTELIECWNQKTPEDPTVVTCEIEVPFSRVEDKFVKNLCSDKFYVHFVSIEDQTVKDTVYLHYSPLLTAKGEPKFESYHNKIKIPQIEYFQLTLTADKELILPLYKEYLNPLEICIIGAKEMPNPNSGYNKYEPVYVQAKFFDGTVIKTHEVAHGNTCKWTYKQVILAGLMDPIKLKEDLKSIPLTFEVHDQDEISKNNIREFKQLIDIQYQEPEPPVEVIDPKTKGGKGAAAAKKKEPEKKEEKPKDTKAKDAKDAKGKKDVKKKKDVKTFEPIKPVDTREFIRVNYGLSNFNLNDLLNPHINALKLRNHIVPLQKFESKDARNLDLNTTARRELQERHAAGDFLANESYLVVTFELAHGIRPFKKPAQPVQDTLNIQQTDLRPKSKGGADAKPPAQPAAKTVPPKKGAPVVEPPKVVEVVDEKPIYERAIYIFPYKSAELTPKLLSIVQKINMKAFGLEDGNPLFITTKALSEEEKKNKDLDIITGLEFIDNEYRTFILEGLSDKAMKRLEEEFPKDQPNSKDIKIFKNSELKFKSRLYIDFNIDVKKIKLRENLTKLLTKPDVYLRSKVPENIYHILVTFNEIRRCENMKAIIASNLFPDVSNTIAMERKYGDALTDEDISGKEGPPQKLVKRTAAKFSTVGSDLGLSAIGSAAASGRASGRGLDSGSQRVAQITQSDEKLPEINNPGPRAMSSRLATRVEKVKHDKYSLHMTQPYPCEGEIFTQAGAKLNIYEKQKAELREIVRNDPNHFYTYSANYLSLSIDPFSTDEVKRNDEDHSKKLWKTKEGFQTILKKDKSEYKVHPKKPHVSKIDELNTHPWHQSKLEETKQLMNTRGEPIRNGPDFRLQIPGITFFSSPEIFEEEKITNVEKERRLKEAKQKAEEEWKAKMKVDNPYFKTSLCMDRNSQLDKIKGIREGEAVKKGLLVKESRLKKTTLGTTKSVQENPISLFLAEGWEDTATKNFFERNVDSTRTVSPYDFKRNIKEAYQYDLVYKPMKKDVFN